jgi:anaerobic selenocysteine-containing dehydrogenase
MEKEEDHRNNKQIFVHFRTAPLPVEIVIKLKQHQGSLEERNTDFSVILFLRHHHHHHHHRHRHRQTPHIKARPFPTITSQKLPMTFHPLQGIVMTYQLTHEVMSNHASKVIK